MRRLKDLLLAGVSATALVLMVEDMAFAADLGRPVYAVPAPLVMPVAMARDLYSVTIEGGLQFQGDAGQSFSPDLFDTTPILPSITSSGFAGAIGASYQTALSPWSFGFNLRMGGTSGSKDIVGNAAIATGISTSGLGFYHATGAVAGKFSRSTSNTILDFEVGRDIGLGGAPMAPTVKMTAGLRFARLGDDHKFEGTVSSAAINMQANRSFQGFGPRIGIAAESAFAGNWSAFGTANAALLFGTAEETESLVYSNKGQFTYSATGSTNRVVTNIDASAGIGYAFTPNAKLSLGYRAEAFFNAFAPMNATLGGQPVAKPIRFDENVWTHGPFVQLKANF